VGFYPDVNTFNGLTSDRIVLVEETDLTVWGLSDAIPITESQYNDMKDFMDGFDKGNSFSTFGPLMGGSNCTTAVFDTLEAGGIPLTLFQDLNFVPWLVPGADALNQFGAPVRNWLTNMYYILAGIIENLRDPLALDLNNDGIATVSANDGIMFDHNNAGIRYGTGWINPQDGWLALDRNGNGTIDSGRELFGDNTRKLDGNFAAHAYDALKSFDTNNDGQVSAADATGDADSSGTIDGSETYWDIDNNGEYDASVDKTFADLRVWVDANSNGNTDGGELKTLAELNIVSIGTGKTAVNVADENGNLNTFKGNYTNTSGEVVDGTRSFNLLQNKFWSDTADHPNIPPDVAALPNMQGSGAVRNLHEAMSLGTPQSLALKATVQAFNNATTRGAQYALIDQLLMQWGSTSGFPDMVQRLEDMKTTYRNNQTGQIHTYQYRFALTTGEFWDDSTDTYNQRNQKVDLIDDPLDKDYPLTREADDHLFVNNPEVLVGQTTAQAAKIQALAKTRVLEAFNNAQFFDFSSKVVLSGTDNPNTPEDERTQSAQFTVSSNNATRSRSGPDGMASTSNIIVMTEDDLPIPQSNYLHASYDQLRESVYSALALQTRLKPYLDAINITLDANGNVAFDFTAMDTALSNKIASEPVNGVLDLIDILKYRGADLEKSGWNAEAQFALIKTTLDSMSSAQRDNLAAAGFNMQYAIPNDSNLASEKTANVLALLSDTATTGSYIKGPVGNVIIGGAANENLIASCSSNVCGQGNDVLFGSAGNDGVYGNEGNDVLWGGAGNDSLYGHTGDDYLSGGDGNDSTMNGGEGNDWLVGGAGNDYMTESKGFDVMQGSAGDDRYYFDGDYSTPGDLDTILFARGDGNDVLYTAGKAANQFAFIQFQAGIEPEHVKPRRIGGSTAVYLDVTDAVSGAVTDTITVNDFFNPSHAVNTNTLNGVVFASGVVWSPVDITALLFGGTTDSDNYGGLAGNDVMHGGAGNDYLTGNGGDDALYGDEGTDTLSGNDGNDVLDGGTGNDTLYGGAGSDTFVFGYGSGTDTVWDPDSTDIVRLGVGVTADDVIVTRKPSNSWLEITLRSSPNDKMILRGTALGKVLLHDGTVLLDEFVLAGLKDKNISLKRSTQDADGDGVVDDNYWVFAAHHLLGNRMPDDEKMRWQIVAAQITNPTGFGADTADIDGDGNTTEPVFFLAENFWNSGVNYVGFLPSLVANSAAAFAFDMQRDDGVTFKATIDVLIQDGLVLNGTTADDIIAGNQATQGITVNGLQGDDIAAGGTYNDTVNGYGGNDTVAGDGGDDVLQGGAGNDQMEAGDYWIDLGNDRLLGGSGSDAYLIGNLWCGDNDTIHNADSGAAASDVDVLSLLNQIEDYRAFWFTRDYATETGGDDLLVTQVGAEYSGTLRIEDWFSTDPEARLDQLSIKEDDGDAYTFLLDSHFDALIQSMSAVTAPASLADLQSSSTYSTVRENWAGLAVPE
jgi:Ca2+-binding RTX toxin-like protein